MHASLPYHAKYAALCLLFSLLAACGSAPKAPPAPSAIPAHTGNGSAHATAPALPPAGSGRGGYYQDDGPGDKPPPDLLAMPDAEPKVEPYSSGSNKPYVVFGKTYMPFTDNRPFKERGVGSWYGKKFHGQKTSSGELYDMYKMTAAHPTLPIPSYARVTNLSNGAQVIVRVNDRGPFHPGRIIDLSYTAALKLGYLGTGSSELEVERLLPDEIERMARLRKNPPVLVQESAPVVASAPPVPVEVAVPVMLPVVAAAPVAEEKFAAGFYLQFGAYSQADNAQAALTRLQEQWSGKLPPIAVAEYGMFYRLYSGPFATRAEAASAAQLVQDAGMSKPLIVQR